MKSLKDCAGASYNYHGSMATPVFVYMTYTYFEEHLLTAAFGDLQTTKLVQ